MIYERQPRYVATILDLGLAVVAIGLALIARSRLYALIAITASSGALYNSLADVDLWFPNASPPFFLSLLEFSNALTLLAQWRFYENFFPTNLIGALPRFASRVAIVVILTFGFIQTFVVPARMYGQFPFLSPWSDTIDYLQALWYVGLAAVAIYIARTGERSAWFVAVGALGFAVASCIGESEIWFPSLRPWVRWAWVFAFPFDIMLFILGIGDQLRQTALSRQRILQERDSAQSSLLSQQRDQIANIESLNRTFARFVPLEFLSQLGKKNLTDVALGDHTERHMAVFFTDLRGFMAMSERLSSEATFNVLNGYFARAGPVIRKHRGFIDKYVGDAIVALFPQRPDDALNAAIEVQSEVRRFNEERSRRGEEPIRVGIGINYGPMLLGTVGEAERYETTVIADSVNIASRLERVSKTFEVGIVVGGALVDALERQQAYGLRFLGEVPIRGHLQPERAYELFDGDPHDLALLKRRLSEQFSAALASYTAGDYVRSETLFGEIVRASPSDTAAAHFRDRSAALQNGGFPSDAPNTTA